MSHPGLGPSGGRTCILAARLRSAEAPSSFPSGPGWLGWTLGVLAHAVDALALGFPWAEPVRIDRGQIPKLGHDLVVLSISHAVRDHHPGRVVLVHEGDRLADRVDEDVTLVGRRAVVARMQSGSQAGRHLSVAHMECSRRVYALAGR